MLKLLIIDDEPHVREGLLDLVEWSALGFEVCGVGTDGEDGMKKIIQQKPHVVLTDIRMPSLTGIEMIKQLKQRHIECEFIILSGYSDFQYAKESIMLNVFDYLVKPIEEEALIDVFTRVREKIEKKQKTVVQLSNYRKIEHENQLKTLLTGDFEEGVEFDSKWTYQIAFIKNRQTNQSWISELTRGQTLDYVQNSEGMTLFFNGNNDKTVYDSLLRVAKKNNLQFTLSTSQLTPREVSVAYKEIKEMAEQFFCYRDTYVLMQQVQHLEEIPFPDTDRLYLAIEFNDVDAKKKSLDTLEKSLQSTNQSPSEIKGALINFQALMIQRFNYHYPDLALPVLEALTEQINQKTTLQDVLEELQKQWSDIAKQIDKEVATDDDGVKKVKRYVKQYYDEDLSLKLMGKILNYNATYLGKKFKQETGESFSKYVDRVRISKAKELLKQEKVKIYEVSEKVGYCNIDYFYRKFKNHVGKSPKEYQKEYQKATKV